MRRVGWASVAANGFRKADTVSESPSLRGVFKLIFMSDEEASAFRSRGDSFAPGAAANSAAMEVDRQDQPAQNGLDDMVSLATA